MWGSVKTTAILVAVEPWKEVDRRYRALTPQGKIEFIGRGARKGKAKLAAHLEPLSVVSLELIRSHRQTTVIGVERQVAFKDISERVVHRLTALAGLHLFDAFTPLDDPHNEAYQNCWEWLEFLNAEDNLTEKRADWLILSLYLRLLDEAGVSLSLSHCLSCRETVTPLAFRYHARRGGLVCTDCFLTKPQDWQGAESLPEEAVVMLRLAARASWADLCRLPFSHLAFAEAIERVSGFSEHHAPLVAPAFVRARSFVAEYC